MPEDIYARPRPVTDLGDCHFYHTTDIPGVGCVDGEWDLRGGLADYLGQVPLAGKRVLDVGAATGFLTFAMERLGAEVVSYDLSENDSWDTVPFPSLDHRVLDAQRREHIRRLNNGYWLCHHAFRSRAQMVYGPVYEIPDAIGPVDVAVFGNILLHLRDPFLALYSALRLTREMVIVTEMLTRRYFYLRYLHRFGPPCLRFVPRAVNPERNDTWWSLTPELVRRFLGVLGFGDTRTTFHRQASRRGRPRLFTIVGRRTVALRDAALDAPDRAAAPGVRHRMADARSGARP
jgi:SAM-dependent methyltransferase